MIEDTYRLHDVARRLLAQEEGTDGDPIRMADAVERVCQKLHQKLGPVIGDTAFRAWTHRALRLTRSKYPFLTADVVLGEAVCLVGLQRSVQGRDPALAGEALTALLAGFLAVFIGLVGKNLLWVYMREAWPEVDVP